MPTMDATQYQTVEAMARKHRELAAFYILTAGDEALEAGKHPAASMTERIHSQTAAGFSREATEQTRKAEALLTYLSERRAAAAAAANEKAKG